MHYYFGRSAHRICEAHYEYLDVNVQWPTVR